MIEWMLCWFHSERIFLFLFFFFFFFFYEYIKSVFFFINIRKRVKGEEENDRGFFHNNKLHKIGYILVVQLMKKIIVGSSCPPPSMLTTTTTTTTTTKTTTIIRNTHWSWCYRRLTAWFKKIIEYCILQGMVQRIFDMLGLSTLNEYNFFFF